METKLVVKINQEISIFSDRNQYMVKICKNTKPEYSYFPTLDMCFQEIFDYFCKAKLANDKDKEMKEVAEIIWNTRKEILEILKPFAEVKSESKH